MKLIIKEYLAALKERGELDAMLPNLLSELGFNVYSRPDRGTRQFGVDIAAVGPSTDGERRVHLFSLKQGDLSRADWDGTPQALRSSLNEIRDVYIPTCIPAEYRDLGVTICIVCGGDIKEAVHQEVRGYIRANETPNVTYEEWNGDRLADLILQGVLREEMFPDPLRSHLRKAAAMVEEPDVSYQHFRGLVDAIVDRSASNQSAKISKIREINVCLWVLFIWGREANNVEAAYRASEYAILRAWDVLKGLLGTRKKASVDAGLAFNDLIELHFSIWDELAAKLLPHVGKQHAISVAVGSFSSVDINLKLHEFAGRLAMRGLWHAWRSSADLLPQPLETAEDDPLHVVASQLFELIDNNPALQSPIADEQAIDIALALMLFATHGGFETVITSWTKALIARSRAAFYKHGAYPTYKSSYWDLVDHPSEKTDEYRKEATAGSILYPLLGLWAAGYGNREATELLAKFAEEKLEHCNFQLWFPNEESEAGLYKGGERHGDMLSDIPLDADGVETRQYVAGECDTNDNFAKLSAIDLGHWPIVLMACRHYRLPVPPQIWFGLLRPVKRRNGNGVSKVADPDQCSGGAPDAPITINE